MRPSHSVLSSVLAGVAFLAGAAAARAQPPSAADPGLQEAKVAFEEAQTLYTKEQFADAAAKFLVAYDKKPFSSFLFNAAVAYEKARALEQAVEVFQRYLTIDPGANDAME